VLKRKGIKEIKFSDQQHIQSHTFPQQGSSPFV
jgi:hypothetical protein